MAVTDTLDSNKYGTDRAFYIQKHVPDKMRKDLGVTGVDVLGLQVHIAHLRPILTGCFYRPPKSNVDVQ